MSARYHTKVERDRICTILIKIQAHSGIFHMLPLGHRVQQKLETLIDKHMSSLGNKQPLFSRHGDHYMRGTSLTQIKVRPKWHCRQSHPRIYGEKQTDFLVMEAR